MATTVTLERTAPRALAAAPAARAYLELTKPGITLFVGMTAAAGFLLAARGVGAPALLVETVLATILTSGGAAALNHVREADADRLMRRTAGRPLPSGVLTRAQATTFAVALTLSGLTCAAAFLPWSTIALLAVCHASYVAAYTPLKRRTPLCTLVGTIPGALPVLVGWSATGAAVDLTALALLGVLVAWQIPHFLAIGWLCRADYARAGFRVLSTVDPTGLASGRVALVYAAALLPMGLVPWLTGDAGAAYALAATLLALGYTALAAAFALDRSAARARRLFFASLVYLPAYLAVLLVAAT